MSGVVLVAAGNPLRAQPGGFSAFGEDYTGGFGGGALTGGFASADARFDPLVTLLVETVKPDSWADRGGAGTIRAVDRWGVVVVRQTDEVHEQIEQLLAVLRQTQREQEAGDGMTPAEEPKHDAKPALVVEPKANAAARKRIEAALDAPVMLDFIETPLADVVEHISEKHGITMELDTNPLDGVGIGSDTPVTRSLSGISLRSALRLILRDFELCYIIQNEVLLITTREEAETALTTRVYRVPDLAIPAN
jgi:type II secretory pathway component GspD/PulD (secretin)